MTFALAIILLLVAVVVIPKVGVRMDETVQRIIVGVLIIGLIVWLLMGGVGAIVRV